MHITDLCAPISLPLVGAPAMIMGKVVEPWRTALQGLSVTVLRSTVDALILSSEVIPPAI